METSKQNNKLKRKAVEHFFTPVELIAKQQKKFFESILSATSKITGVDSGDTSNYFDLIETYNDITKNVFAHPERVLSVSSWLIREQSRLYERTLLRFLGRSVVPVITPEDGDRRFNYQDWQDNPIYDYIKQAYLINSKALIDLVESLDEHEEDTKEQHLFYIRQMINSLSPSNFPVTNPEVMKMTLKSGGRNLREGIKNFIEDRKAHPKSLNVSMTDFKAFEVGKNLATTPGKVVFQNEMMQLIQYTPTTTKVARRPLLIIPPWINKYYILDMKAESSFIKWVVDQGQTTFIISWVNPTKSLGHKNWENYLTEGTLAALDAIYEATGEKEVNSIGYCIGGTLQATTLAYMAAKNDDRVKSATYFTTLLDFTDPGGIGVFINEKMIKGLEQRILKHGIYDGRSMSFSFSLLRENDLYWSYFINNYLKGEKPTAFDILYWNTDSTNMPGKMHTYYLRNMYLENRLRIPGGIELNGTAIDLSKIKIPVYFLSTIQDHIAKWKATYLGVSLHSGPVNFVLSGSGHIAGVVNPPKANKYGFWTNEKIEKDPDVWLGGATKHEGSWWPNWKAWVSTNSGCEVDARVPGTGKLPILEDAPGSYVKTKIKDLPHD